jgi:hypothetical protein
MVMNKEQEIDLIHKLLLHPAGYNIDIDGKLLVREYEWPQWAVEWDDDDLNIHVAEFENALDAATFFVNKRHEMQLGLDFERKL